MADAAKYSLADILRGLRECAAIRLQTGREFQFPEFRHNRRIGWMSAEDFAKELERRITLNPGAERHRTFCRARGKPWNADTFDTFCAQAAERERSTLAEFLKRDAAAGFFQWDVSAGAAYWVTGTPSPAAKQEQSEGNGKAGKTRNRKGIGGRKRLAPKEARKRETILADWQQAKGAGIRQKQFCRNQGISTCDLEKFVAWQSTKTRRKRTA